MARQKLSSKKIAGGFLKENFLPPQINAIKCCRSTPMTCYCHKTSHRFYISTIVRHTIAYGVHVLSLERETLVSSDAPSNCYLHGSEDNVEKCRAMATPYSRYYCLHDIMAACLESLIKTLVPVPTMMNWQFFIMLTTEM